MKRPWNWPVNCLTITSVLFRLILMRSEREQQDPLSTPAYRELKLLTEVDKTPEANQRQLSLKVGIALGLTNMLLRNLVQKGYVRVSNATWKRRFYSLTPDGIRYRLRLTAAYITRVLDHYQNVRQSLREQMETLAVNEESRVAIYGTSEFAELVFLGLKEIGIEEIDMYSPGSSGARRFLGMPVHDVTALRPENYDKIVIAMLDGSEAASMDLLDRGVSPHKVVTLFVHASEKGSGGSDGP